MTQPSVTQILSDITVLDLTRARSGPTAVRQLADWGANVIKIETPGAPDSADLGRRHGPDFQNLHRNKQSMTLDLKSDQGREIFYRMTADADVVVENMRPGVKHRLNVDYETLKAINPQLIYASISGFGQDGPYSERPCLDQIAQGIGGHMMVTGEPGTGPMRSGAAISDMMAGILCANGIMLALYDRERSGEGQWVQTSLLEAMIFLLDFQAARWLVDGEIPPQAGNHHPSIAPMGAFRTSDSYINIAPMPEMWDRFCSATGLENLLKDPRFTTFDDRYKNRPALVVEIEKVTVTNTSAHWIGLLNGVRIPCGPIYTLDEAFADPQVIHTRIAKKVHTKKMGDIEIVAQPLHLTRTPNRHDTDRVTAAPEYGEHTIDILQRYGYSDEDISELTGDRVI
ncbi:MAG: CoA transferase [Pseudomonadota bacterium]|nr:CoA transferase [Pseudomonadota bacterium]